MPIRQTRHRVGVFLVWIGLLVLGYDILLWTINGKLDSISLYMFLAPMIQGVLSILDQWVYLPDTFRDGYYSSNLPDQILFILKSIPVSPVLMLIGYMFLRWEEIFWGKRESKNPYKLPRSRFDKGNALARKFPIL